VYVCLL